MAIALAIVSISGTYSGPTYADPFSETLKDLEQEAQVQELYADASAWFYFEQYSKLPASDEGTRWANQISFAQQSSKFWHLIRYELQGLLLEYEKIGKPLYRIQAVQTPLRNIIGQLIIAGRKSAHDLQMSIAGGTHDSKDSTELFQSTLTRINSGKKSVTIKNENRFVESLIEASKKPKYMETRFDLVQFYEESQSFKNFLELLLPFAEAKLLIQVASWADILSRISDDQLLRREKLCNLFMHYRKGLSIEDLSFAGPQVDEAVLQIKSEINRRDLTPLSEFIQKLSQQPEKKHENSVEVVQPFRTEFAQGDLATLFSLTSDVKLQTDFFKQFLLMGGKRSNNKFGKRLYLPSLDQKTRVYFKLNSRLWTSSRAMRHLLATVFFRAAQGQFQSPQEVEERAFGKTLQNQQLLGILELLQPDQFIDLPKKNTSICKTAVSQLLFYRVLKNNPSLHKTAEYCPGHATQIDGTDLCPFYPVERIQWRCSGHQNSVQEFLNDLNLLLRSSGANYGYRLPTRAEYAWASELNALEQGHKGDYVTFWTETQPQQTHSLTAKLPNHKGFYNSGVMEWTDEMTQQDEGSHYVSCGSYSLIEAAYPNPPALNPDYSDADMGFRLVKFLLSEASE